ncbi:MAG: hypothetical protein KF752_13245 [Pirellulaceae bacterium]|nr:hypothetical protein [Pirellulaceae bacterium]
MAKIPSRLEDLLPVAAFEKVVDALQRPELSHKVRDALSKVGLKDVNPLQQAHEAWQQVRSWLSSLAGDSVGPDSELLNATGSLFLSNADRWPIISSAAWSYARAATAYHDRQRTMRRSNEAVRHCLAGCNHLWLSDMLGGLQLVSRTLAPGGLVMARTDCVRLAGVGDVQRQAAAWGNSVSEVGTVNGVEASDWQQALSNRHDQAILLVSPNNLDSQTAAAQRAQALTAAKKHNAPVIELLADGCLSPQLSQQMGFPLANQRCGDGTDVVLLPTHLLLGGMSGLLCLGGTHPLERISQAASSLGAGMDASTVAANVLAMQLASVEDDLECGLVIGGLVANPQVLKNRSQRLAVQLSGLGPIAGANVVDRSQPLGPAPWCRYQLAGPAIQVHVSANASTFFDWLETGGEQRAAIAMDRRVDPAYIDLRFVAPEDDHRIVAAVGEWTP